jgi:drug/metabolite transporter (DMT)-like permease
METVGRCTLPFVTVEEDSPRRYPWLGLLNLVVTYFVWGSTYLAIRVAVREGAGWGPFWLGASRVLVAAALLFLINRMRNVRMRPTAAEMKVLVISGLLLWVGGNGGVNWAEQRIDSSLAALIIGAMPIWVALIEGVLDRRAPSSLLVISLVTGFAGLVVLTSPAFDEGLSGDAIGVLVVVGASISWGVGSVVLSRRPVGLDSIVTSGWQHLAGGVGFVVFALAVQEPLPDPTPAAWAAWAYLVVFGSLLAFTSFVVAVRLLPVGVVMTYSYVNPVVAVILGRLILSEPITKATIAGMILIIAGVWGVFRDKRRAG